ncbi:MAG: hypothetical protein AAF517_15400 [Planctomycetota bacterium]
MKPHKLAILFTIALVSACAPESGESDLDREFAVGQQYLQSIGVDVLELANRVPLTRRVKETPDPLEGAVPLQLQITNPIAVRNTTESIIDVSYAQSGEAAFADLDIKDPTQFALEFSITVEWVDFNGHVDILVMSPEGSKRQSVVEISFSRFGGRGETFNAFAVRQYVDGDRYMRSTVYEESQPGFLVGVPYRVRVDCSRDDLRCKLKEANNGGEAFAPRLRVPTPNSKFLPSGSYRFIVSGDPRTDRESTCIRISDIKISGATQVLRPDEIYQARDEFSRTGNGAAFDALSKATPAALSKLDQLAVLLGRTPATDWRQAIEPRFASDCDESACYKYKKETNRKGWQQSDRLLNERLRGAFSDATGDVMKELVEEALSTRDSSRFHHLVLSLAPTHPKVQERFDRFRVIPRGEKKEKAGAPK